MSNQLSVCVFLYFSCRVSLFQSLLIFLIVLFSIIVNARDTRLFCPHKLQVLWRSFHCENEIITFLYSILAINTVFSFVSSEIYEMDLESDEVEDYYYCMRWAFTFEIQNAISSWDLTIETWGTMAISLDLYLLRLCVYLYVCACVCWRWVYVFLKWDKYVCEIVCIHDMRSGRVNINDIRNKAWWL